MAEFFENYEAVVSIFEIFLKLVESFQDLLDCEKALVGGRTEVFKLHLRCEGKKGYYLDVVR